MASRKVDKVTESQRSTVYIATGKAMQLCREVNKELGKDACSEKRVREMFSELVFIVTKATRDLGDSK